jgi:predicted O-methyltransferase YrrM
MDFDDVYETYKRKIEPYFDKVLYFRKTTMDYLTHPRVTNFEFIYVDADHTTVGVLLDAELSWPHLESGGIMAFDDYTWGHESGDPRLAPQVGIDLFLHRHQGEYELLAKNTQVWIRKK